MATLTVTADGTVLLNAVQTAILGLYNPSIPTIISREEASRGKPKRLTGWTAGYPSTCFILSLNGPEEVDGTLGATFENMVVRYWVAAEYLKPIEQAIPNNSGGPPGVLDDPDVRNKRFDLLNLLYTQYVTGVSNLFDTRAKPGPVYQQTLDDRVITSMCKYLFDLHNPRPGTF